MRCARDLCKANIHIETVYRTVISNLPLGKYIELSIARHIDFYFLRLTKINTRFAHFYGLAGCFLLLFSPQTVVLRSCSGRRPEPHQTLFTKRVWIPKNFKRGKLSFAVKYMKEHPVCSVLLALRALELLCNSYKKHPHKKHQPHKAFPSLSA